jgi:RecA/RadA recombinase
MGRKPKEATNEQSNQAPIESTGISIAAARAKKFLEKYRSSEYESILSESKIANTSDWISSGSYSLNKVLSGSYYKGFADNRIYVLAGPSSTGKSYLCAKTIFQAQQKGYTVFMFETENAIDVAFMQRFGVKVDELIHIPVKTINDFRNKAIDKMKKWRSDEDTKDVPALFFCDSLGMLAGTKETNDVEDNKSASDMGQRAKELRACARSMTIECAHNHIPLIATNHTYEQAAANPQAAPVVKMTGGEGFYYAASAVVFLKKRQVKEEQKDALGDNVKVKTGNIIIATAEKNRFVPEGTKAEMYIDIARGMQPYYGLLIDAVQHGYIELRGTRYYVKHLDKTFFETKIYTEEVFGPIIKELSEKVEATFQFSSVLKDDTSIDFEDKPENKIDDIKPTE